MLKTIKTKLNKTPIENQSSIVRNIECIDQSIVSPLLKSHLLSEGVYGFETVTSSELSEVSITTPSFYRERIGVEVYREYSNLLNNLNNLHCYDIVLSNPSFLPLYTEEPSPLLQQFSLLQMKENQIYTQFLFSRRTDHWQEEMINMYQSYLEGNDYPSNSKAARRMQKTMLNVISKVGGFNFRRKGIEEIEHKILDNGYRFELRLIIYSEEDVKPIESELVDILKEMNFFNELRMEKVKNKKMLLNDFINRRFSVLSHNQMVSEAELVCMITDDMTIDNDSKSIVEVQEQIKKEVTKKFKHTSIINTLPVGEKRQRQVDEELVSSLPYTLKKAKATKADKIDILDVEVGATVQRITFKIPNGGVYSDIKNKHEDIKAVMGMELSIIQGNEPNSITFLIPCKERDIIYLKELLENPEFIKFAEENPLPFICGIDMYNKPIYKCLTKAPHLLISGATNSGKSVFMNALLITLILLRKPEELIIYLIDPKKVELIQYDGVPHVMDVIIDMKKALNTLNSLVNEMEARYDKMSKLGVKNIKAYNDKSKSKLPYILCAIDEYNDLRIQMPRVEDLIEQLGQKARASGIHLILATQRPDKEVLSGVIKTNLPSRISFRLDNSNEYRTVFGTGIPYNLLGFGDGVVKFVGQTEEFIRFQAPVISLDEQQEEEVFDNIKKMYKGERVEGIEVVEVIQEEPIDKLKRIIAQTGETRVAKLREEMGIRINDVSDLIKQLVDEGWLTKEGRGYEITANENELNEWREKDG